MDAPGTCYLHTDSLVDLAHTGADGDTLETLSDQIDAVQDDVTDILANTGKIVYGAVYSSEGEKKNLTSGSTTGFIEDEKESR